MIKCPACSGDGRYSVPMMGDRECAWCRGVGELAELPPPYEPLIHPLRLCCAEARLLPLQCTCTAQTWCEEHGTACHGRHV
jgi:hypothetical protein